MKEVKKSGSEFKQDSRRTSMSMGSVIINKMGIYVVVLLLLVVGLIIRQKEFVSVGNLRSILSAVSLMGMCCAGLAFVVSSANFNDMSLPMIIALSGMMAVQLIPYGIVVSLLGGVVVGTLVGVVNGIQLSGPWRLTWFFRELFA